MKKKLLLVTALLFMLSFAWAVMNETSKFSRPVTEDIEIDHHQILTVPKSLKAEELHTTGMGTRNLRQGSDVVWMDDFELESMYYYYVGASYFWEAPTEYPGFAVRYTPFHSGTLAGAWFFFYDGDATEVTLTFYDDDAGYPGTDGAAAGC